MINYYTCMLVSEGTEEGEEGWRIYLQKKNKRRSSSQPFKNHKTNLINRDSLNINCVHRMAPGILADGH